MELSLYIKDKLVSGKRIAIPIMTHPGIELLGKQVSDAVTNGEIHYHAIRALNECFPQSTACTTIMDLTVEAEAFGARLSMSPNEVPSVCGRLLTGYADVEALQIPSVESGRMPQYLLADRLAAEGIDKPVLAGCIGPYSLAGRLYDMTEIMMAIYTEPDTVLLLLEKCTEFILRYCLAIKETGVAGVIMAEPAAGLLSNEDCQRYSSVYVKRIIDAVQDDSFAVILHNCGNTGHCTAAMLATGAKGYHFGNKADMITALRECPSDVRVMGNLDPVGVFRVLTPEDVFARTEELLTCTGEYANFIISTGCDTPPEVPFDNIQAFYLAVEKYNKGR